MIYIDNNALELAHNLVKTIYSQTDSAHDLYHIERVLVNAKKIANQIDCNYNLVCLIALLHDVDDKKLFPNQEDENYHAKQILTSINLNERDIEFLAHEISIISFSKKSVPNSIEAKIVQDADRLDAIGAVGIARTFTYGGSKGRPIYSRTEDSTIQHFYGKLLLLGETLNFSYSKEIASQRIEFMKSFLEQFHKEIDM